MTEQDLINSISKHVDAIRICILNTVIENEMSAEQYDTFIEMLGIETDNLPCHCEIFS